MAVTEVVETTVAENGCVRSRVSWGAIMAGAVIALAVYFLLSLLGVAVGLSVSNGVEGDNLSTGAAIWAFVSLIVALFFGGWVATQCTAGENQTEAVLYGVVVWAVTSSLLVLLAAQGMRLGYQSILTAGSGEMGRADLAAQIQQAGREVGLTDNEIADFQAAMEGQAAPAGGDGAATATAWWAFGGALLSILAAIGGALFGPYEVSLHRHRYVSTTARGTA